MYGMPQPNTYGQYAFTGYGGFPNQAGGTPGAGAPGAAGMPQPASGAGGLGLGLAPGGQAPGADASGGQAGQAQWATDPSSYYSNYWGGVWMFICDFIGRELMYLRI